MLIFDIFPVLTDHAGSQRLVFGIAIDDVQTTVSGVPKSLEPCYFKKIPKFG